MVQLQGKIEVTTSEMLLKDVPLFDFFCITRDNDAVYQKLTQENKHCTCKAYFTNGESVSGTKNYHYKVKVIKPKKTIVSVEL